MDFKFMHNNFNVLDLEKSLAFYNKALGLSEVRRFGPEDGRYIIVFLGDGETDFQLELTWIRDRTEPYDLGEGEFHLAFVTRDIEASRSYHAQMGCICYENHKLGIYFIEDPDGYWLEIVPDKS